MNPIRNSSTNDGSLEDPVTTLAGNDQRSLLGLGNTAGVVQWVRYTSRSHSVVTYMYLRVPGEFRRTAA